MHGEERNLLTLPAMYDQTQAQTEAEARLRKQGFKFSNWIPAEPDADGEPMDEKRGTMVVVRRASRFSREYREIQPDGTVN